MKSFQFIVRDELGIHARPAGMLAKECIRFKSTIKIKKGDKEAVASRLLMLMGLGVKCGDEITVSVEGEDEEEACQAILQFFKDNL